MKANELRRSFTSFFTERGHTEVASASVIPHDKTLLFTNAGMVPFKPYFVGEETPPHSRVVSVQKAVRAGGKHNDLEEVGRTTRHLTFFEMMGNFSFGDYFKKEAIAWAWEFVTETLGLDADKLWVTVHLTDDEASAIWTDEVGVAADRVQRLDEDNWWRMADTGPNGPCSEIFYDLGPEFGEDGGPAEGGEHRFIEIWNLVFMQFEQQEDGTQVSLPKPSIDTGAGLERILTVLQGVSSVWETDEFARLLAIATEITGVADGADPESDVSLRVFADHARSTAFMISDGVFPSNEDRGFVLRRIIRRAVRHAYILGVETTVMPRMVDGVVEIMGADYPEIVKNHSYIRDVIEREEEVFRQTLATGSNILDSKLSELSEGDVLPGEVAFQLHDTYGFPLGVTEEIVAERGVTVDHVGFEKAMDEQRTRAKAARSTEGGDFDPMPFREIADSSGPTDFVGREVFANEATVLLVDEYSIVLDATPFYAESGGQVGDTGTISTETGTATISNTTYAVPGVHRMMIGSVEGTIEVGQKASAAIDTVRRDAIRRNHTGTHILHWALRKVLGDHVKQQGSYVGPDRLRFDFSHYDALKSEEIAQIEDLVNGEILDNGDVRHFETSKDNAEQLGAIAFFGDKYGDVVRVLEAGHNSVELCGGTHVSALGDIGPVKIIAESSVGSNIRRLEALTGNGPIERLRHREELVGQVAELVGVSPDDIVDGVQRRLAEAKSLRKEIADLRRQVAIGQAGELAAQAIGGVLVAKVEGLDQGGLRDLAVAIRDRDGIDAVVLGSAPDKGVFLAAAVSPGADYDAGALIEEAKKSIGGGGRPGADLATAGGKAPENLDAALDQARAAAGL